MKEFFIIIISLLLVIVPNIIFKNYLEKSGDELINILEEMDSDLENKIFDEKKLDELKESFLEKEGKWILIVDHDILDEIENGVEECLAFYDAEDKMEFNSSFGKLKNYIEDLTRREEFSVRNIL